MPSNCCVTTETWLAVTVAKATVHLLYEDSQTIVGGCLVRFGSRGDHVSSQADLQGCSSCCLGPHTGLPDASSSLLRTSSASAPVVGPHPKEQVDAW